jgi:hypothetical protein
MRILATSLITSLAVMLVGCAQEQAESPQEVVTDAAPSAHEAVAADDDAAAYSPYVQGYPQRVLFGDTHVHTARSNDAFGAGNRLGPEEAYRFGRGDEIVTSHGEKARILQPLDFLIVADHAEAYTAFQQIEAGNPEMMKDETVQEWNALFKEGTHEAHSKLVEAFANALLDQSLPKVLFDKDILADMWISHLDITEKYNDPGKFTTFHGYEWTSTPQGRNLHRVVIFKDGKDKPSQILPFSATESEDPEDLFAFFESYQEKTGGDVLSIAHNGNWSSGSMFGGETESGNPVNKAYAELRMKWEPIYEVTQMKGDGEAHPMLSPDDEFADFETWDTDLSGSPLTVERLTGEYGRSGLKRGLQLEQKIGANPYKVGFIGSTDTHTSMSTAADDNNFGKLTHVEPSRDRASHVIGKLGEFTLLGKEMIASGYAGVWAHENTRESIFDAMRRKETYATTGPRMLVRFFGGWDFEAEDANTRLPGEAGYEKGVPMGGDLTNAPDGKAPTFLVAALKDVYSGNLDRIQIIKGWVDAEGNAQEKVYDVAVSDGRRIGPDGRCKTPVGNTVDLKKATWTNTIGAPDLITVWKDPDFNPNQKAFYYARVIEIPTPRWSAYDAVRYSTEMGDDVKMITQERAYTSPIWYTPQ